MLYCVLVLQSGCCKPPTLCGYQYVNPTMWINPVNPVADADCAIWNNDPSQLCYNCNSCKAGLLGNLRKEWRRANIILIITVVVLIWVYLIGCSAYRNAQTEELFRRYKQGWAQFFVCSGVLLLHLPLITAMVLVPITYLHLCCIFLCFWFQYQRVHIPLYCYSTRFSGLNGFENFFFFFFSFCTLIYKKVLEKKANRIQLGTSAGFPCF